MPNALARGLLKSQIPVVGVIVHDITDPYFAEVVRGVEDAADAGRLPRDHLLAASVTATREASYVRLLRSMRAAGVIFAGSGLDDPALDRGAAAPRRRACAPSPARPSSTSRPTRCGEPEVSVDNAGRHRVDGRGARRRWATGGSRSWPGPRRCTWRASGSPATGADSPRRASRSTSGSIVDTGFSAEARRARGRRRCSPRIEPAPTSPRSLCANDLLALGALQRLHELGIERPGRRVRRGFDDIPVAAMTAPSPVHRPPAAARDGPARLRRRDPRAQRRARPSREILPTEVVLRDSTGRATLPLTTTEER